MAVGVPAHSTASILQPVDVVELAVEEASHRAFEFRASREWLEWCQQTRRLGETDPIGDGLLEGLWGSPPVLERAAEFRGHRHFESYATSIPCEHMLVRDTVDVDGLWHTVMWGL